MPFNISIRVIRHWRLYTCYTAIMDEQAQRKARVFSRKEIEGQIANGKAIVIVDSKVLNVGAWMPYHPGGDKAMRHMIGRDATDEVTRYAAYTSSVVKTNIPRVDFTLPRLSSS